MKKRLQFSFCILVAFLVLPLWGEAQVCTPDPSYTAAGIYPDSLPSACLNQSYSETVTLVIPSDTIFLTFSFDIDSVVLNDVVGLPPGMSYDCEPSSCSFPGGSSSCVLVSGAPTVPGTYEVDIITTFYVFNFVAGALAIPDTQEAYYTIIVPEAPSLSFESVGANCNQTNGSAMVTATGEGPFTYLWSDGQTNAQATNLASGVYSVTVTDVCGASTTESVTVPSLDITISQDSVKWTGCAESMGGSIFVSVAGGAGSYSYSWDNGVMMEDLTGIASGTYVLTVTDGNNCVVAEQFDAIAPPILTITEDSTMDNTCYGDSSGAIFTTVEGGFGGYTYSWDTDPIETTADVDGLSGGTYTLMVTDESGCIKTLSSTISEPDSFFIAFADTAESSAGAEDGRVEAMVTGGTAPYTYEWNTGDSTATLDSLATGTYILTVTDSNGCEIVDSVAIEQWAVGIDDELAAGISRMDVYPNPNTGTFRLNVEMITPQKIVVGIYDMKGKQVYSSFREKSQTHGDNITLDGISKGMYLLKVNTSGGTAVRRIVIY